MEQYQRLAAQVGDGDKARLDSHATAIRSLEQSLGLLDGAPAAASAGCQKPAPVNPTDFVTIGKAQMDLLAMALACDLTRVASLQWRSSLTAFPWVNVNAEHHILSHQTGSAGADASLTKICTWNTEQFAYLLGLLKASPDLNGTTLLDNTLVYWPNELSNGRHKLQNVPIVIATGDFTAASGQKLPTGRYLKYPGRDHGQWPADPPRADLRPADQQLRRRPVAPGSVAQPAVSRGPVVRANARKSR